jgi:hypothetical protein
MEIVFRFKNWCLKIDKICHYHAVFWRKFPRIPGHDFERPISSCRMWITNKASQSKASKVIRIEARCHLEAAIGMETPVENDCVQVRVKI